MGSPLIASFLKNPDLTFAVRIFSPVPLCLLPTIGLDSIYATYKKTYISAAYTVLTKILQLLCVVLPVFLFQATVEYALGGFLVASFVSATIALYLKNKPFKGYQHRACTYTYKDIFKFSMPLMAASIWGMFINSSDQFFISRYFGTVTFAEFSNGAMELPFVGMIISACSTVLYPLFSKYSHDKLDAKAKIYPIWLSVFNKTAMLIYPLVIFCWFFADSIMGVLYGAQYENSGIYFRIKLFANIFTLIAFAPVILSIGKTGYYAKVHAYGALILILWEFAIVKFIPNPYLVVVISVVCHIGRIFAMLWVVASYFQVSIAKLFPIGLICKIIIPSAIYLFIIERIFDTTSLLMNLVLGGGAYMVFMAILSYVFKLNYLHLLDSVRK